MSREIRADYSQTLMFPPCLEDWVDEDHPARFIRELVDSLDLKELGFRERESDEGRPNYANDLLLKVWLYAYAHRILSHRGLEKACREHVSLLWLTGMQAPDHNTLWRFFRAHSEAIQRVFVETVKIAKRSGLVGMVVHAVDGTKIKSRGSDEGAHHRRALERAEKELEVAAAALAAEMTAEIEAAAEREEGEYRLPEEMRDPERRKQIIREALAELNEAGTNHLQPTEPEARKMKTGDGLHFAYNAQAVVDDRAGIVVAQDVTNEQNDLQQLLPMVDKVKESLGENAKDTVADAGYASSQQLAEVEDREGDVTVSLPSNLAPRGDGNEFHSSRFSYERETDTVTCPRGETLAFDGEHKARHGDFKVRRFRCRQFRDCPDRDRCSRDKRGRVIQISPYHEAVQRQRDKQDDPAKMAVLRRRAEVVEPLFGEVKHNRGFRRWSAFGLKPARTQWAWICTAVNLSKLYRAWLNGELRLVPTA